MAKAGRPKKGDTNLPSWFDIKKYERVKTFNAKDWSEQLEFRKNLESFLNFRSVWPDINPFVDKLLEYWLDLIQNNPLPSAKELEEWPLYVLDPAQEEFENHPLPNPTFGIVDIDNGFIIDAYRALPEKELKWTNLEWQSITGKIKYESKEHKDFVDNLFLFFDEPAKKIPLPTVMIDLSLPDEVLIEEFKEYLLSKRKVMCVKSNNLYFKNIDFMRWRDCGVLAFMDLEMWSDSTGQTLHMPSFADQISSLTGKSIGESSLNKTVKSYAEKLMDIRTLRILRSQAAREESGRLKKSRKLCVK